MPSSNVCWGIEVGAGAIKALKLEREGDGVKVVDFAVIPHKKVLSTPDLDQVDAVRVALGALVSQFDLRKATIAISIPGHSAFARFAKLPPVEPKKIPDIVKFEAVQQIPFPIDDVEWDYQTFANPDSPDVEVGIFAVTRERVMEKLAQWHDVGVTPDIVNLSPISVFNAIAYDLTFSPKTPGTVILDVGTTSTDLIVAEAGRVWVRTFPIGGHQFTEALVEAFKLTYSKAEKLKKEAETSKHARHVFQAMRPVFSDLAQEVQRSIGYYQSLHREANLTRLIVLGATFNLPGLKKYLGQQLQMEVVQLGQFNRMTLDGPRAGEFQAATLNLSTAYGLALQGLGLAAIDANLMPVAVLRESMWKGKVKWFAAAAGLSVVAGGLTFVRYFMDQTKLDSNPRSPEIAQVKTQLTQLKRDWTEVESGYTPDFSAANATILLENRDVIPWISEDVGQVMKAAQEEAARSPSKIDAPPGFIFERLSTIYTSAGAEWDPTFDLDTAGYGMTPPPSAAGMTSRPMGGEDAGGRGRTPMPPSPASPAPEGATSSAPTGVDGVKYQIGDGPPRVIVTLTVKTAREDAFDFIAKTAQRWLTENKEREGAPYSIKHIEWARVGEEVVPGLAEGQPEPGVQGAISRKGPVRPPPGYEDPSQYRRQIGEGSTADRPGARGGDPNQLAPLPVPDRIAPPGTKITTFEVRWEAYLKSWKAPTEGGA